jgi:hypothetical protein
VWIFERKYVANYSKSHLRVTVPRHPGRSEETLSPSQKPGAWAGSLQSIEREQVGISVTQSKWEKGQGIVHTLARSCVGALVPPDLPHKQLKKDRGFLVHLCMTFKSITPFLKGLHLTLAQWWVGRDPQSDKEHQEWMRHFYHTCKGQDYLIYDILNAGAPATVCPLPWFIDSIHCLVKIFDSASLPVIILRAVFIFLIVYDFGDASGK